MLEPTLPWGLKQLETVHTSITSRNASRKVAPLLSSTGIYNTRKVRSVRHVCDEFDEKRKNNNRVQVKRWKCVPGPIPRCVFNSGPWEMLQKSSTSSIRNTIHNVKAEYGIEATVRIGFLRHIPLTIYNRQVWFANVGVKKFTDGHAVNYSTSPRSDKNGKKGFPTETPDRFWPFWGPVVGGDTFSSLAPILGPEKKSDHVAHFKIYYCSWRRIWCQNT